MQQLPLASLATRMAKARHIVLDFSKDVTNNQLSAFNDIDKRVRRLFTLAIGPDADTHAIQGR